MHHCSMFYYLYIVIGIIMHIVKLGSHDRRGLLVWESKGMYNEDDKEKNCNT